MTGRARLTLILFFAFAFTALAPHVAAQRTTLVLHRVEGRIQFRGPVNDVRVRILQRSGLIPVDQAFTRDEGHFTFSVPEGEYIIETDPTEQYQASHTNLTVLPFDSSRPEVFRVFIQLDYKPPEKTVKPGVITADVDLHVPKEAQKHYREGMKALSTGSHENGIAELQAAVKAYPDYYAARLELGRELRMQKRFKEAAEILQPTLQLAPKRAEARVEYGITLMALDRRDEAVATLRAALQLEETSWVSHLYLGIGLMEKDAAEAEQHLRRALELNEQKAVRAYLSLARLASAKGQTQLAVEHLQTYLTLAPNAPDAESVRQLMERLRAKN